MADNELYGGLIRLHVLHHAGEAPVFGLGIIKELNNHGYQISAGTLYPMLHGLEKKRLFVIAPRAIKAKCEASLRNYIFRTGCVSCR